MNKGVPLAEAKTTLSECIREVESGKSVLITRHGKPVAALVCPKDLDNLERLRKAGPEGGLAILAGEWKGPGQLPNILDESIRLGKRNDLQLNGQLWLVYTIPVGRLNRNDRTQLEEAGTI